MHSLITMSDHSGIVVTKKGEKLIAIYYLMRSRMANLYTWGTSADYTNFLMRLFRKKKPSAQQQTTSFESFV